MKINNSANISPSMKKQPSFGSSFTEKIGRNVLSSDTFKKVAGKFEYDKFSMSLTSLLVLLYGATIVPRYVQATDKHDKREILTRDMLSITAILFGAKALAKGFSQVFSKISGLVLNNKPINHTKPLNKLFNYLRPKQGVKLLTSQELTAKYSNIKGYPNGIFDFFKFIEGQKGDLGKVLAADKGVRANAKIILGKDVRKATVQEIKDGFAKAEGSKELENIYEILEKPDNKLVKKAKTMNSAFDFLATVLLVPGFMIWLEKYNEKVTKRRIAQELNEKNVQAENSKAPVVTNIIKTAQNSSSNSKKHTFAYFLGEGNK